MPRVRQKWARFVQQPMLTCWQVSTSWPVRASLKRARPPSQPGRDFQERDGEAARSQGRGGRQPGKTAADDDNTLGHLTSPTKRDSIVAGAEVLRSPGASHTGASEYLSPGHHLLLVF